MGNPFFSSAYYDEAGETFVVELRDDDKTVLNIPVVDNFLFSISDASGEQLFKAGETKIYPIVKKGVGATVVTRPEGWTVRLSSSEIAITAPAQDGRTRGAVADTRTDVAVLAYCTFDDYATITKVKVSLEGASGTHDPRASIYEEGEVTTSEIGYTVTLSDATSYKYVFRKTSEGALTLEEVAEQGTPSEETALRFQGLEARTEYTLYVLPYHEETAGTELATCTIRTAEPVYTSYYEAYNAGEVLTVGGLAISKSLFGEAVLLTEETKTIKTDGVYFVPDGVTAAYGSGAGKRGNLIVVGDNPSKRGEFAFVGTVTRIDFDPARGGNFVLCNLHFKLATDSGQGQILFFPNNESRRHDEYGGVRELPVGPDRIAGAFVYHRYPVGKYGNPSRERFVRRLRYLCRHRHEVRLLLPVPETQFVREFHFPEQCGLERFHDECGAPDQRREQCIRR